jgi:rRNA maturation protein Rpf1
MYFRSLQKILLFYEQEDFLDYISIAFNIHEVKLERQFCGQGRERPEPQ